MKCRILVFISIMLFIFSSLAYSQSKETGAILGTVFDDTNSPLPGVSIVLSSPSLMGGRTVITDTEGNYRFPALPPGDYVIQAELQGFTKVIQENIRLTTTVKLTVNLVLKPAAIEEETTVIAQSPTIDIKSSETASVTLENEILRNIPYSNIYVNIVELAPGVSSHSAYGASNYTGISYQVDGVDLSDPEEGGAWVLLDPNIIEEAKIMGLGLPAEYGNYTGIIFNVITKSGGNELSGHFEATFQGKADDWPRGFWQSENNVAYTDDFPDMTSPVARLTDFGAHLGGPIKKDKIWFYLGAQYYHEQDFPAGFPESGILKQP
ncbi:MAG: carboxypeptidase-like regulatory domain-containing protein, partial [Candidatus Aminicenantaceae bacterium]